MKASYDVRVTRDGSGPWEATVEGLTGATYARSLPKLDTYVRELVVLGDDLPDDAEGDVVLAWHFDDPELQSAHDLAQQLEELRRRQNELVALTHQEMRRLLDRGLSTRDVAVVVRSTSGRVSQVRPRTMDDDEIKVVHIQGSKRKPRTGTSTSTVAGKGAQHIRHGTPAKVAAVKTAPLTAAAKAKSPTPQGRG